jgi:hypothetical protein
MSGLRDQVTAYDPKWGINVTYYDCSSFIWYALKAGGFDVVAAHQGQTWPFTTFDMMPCLERMGFVEIDRTGQILPGDVCVNYVGEHTEMVYEGGAGVCRTMGAHGAKGRDLPDQVSIRANSQPATDWEHIFRYGTGGAGRVPIAFAVAAAMCGNFWQESGINPGIYEGQRVVPLTDNSVYGGYGLGQWTNGGAQNPLLTRRTEMVEWLRANGYADDSGEGQLAFLVHEDYWHPRPGYTSAFSSLQDFLNSDSTDIDFLTQEYMWCWEGINDGTLSTRIQAAHLVYDYLLRNANDASIQNWIVGNRLLSEPERLHNAVLVWRLTSASGGGGGTDVNIINPIYRPYHDRPRAWFYLKNRN